MRTDLLSLLFAFILFVGCSSSTNPGPTQPLSSLDTQPQYSKAEIERRLLALGAFRVSDITTPYEDRGNPGHVYDFREGRQDVEGWMEAASRQRYLSEEKQKELGLPKAPLSSEACLSNLDPELFGKNPDELGHFLIAQTLEHMLRHEIIVPEPDKLLAFYKADLPYDRELFDVLEPVMTPRLLKLMNDIRFNPEIILIAPIPKKENDWYLHYYVDCLDYVQQFDDLRISRLLKSKHWETESASSTADFEHFLLANYLRCPSAEEREGFYEDMVRVYTPAIRPILRYAILYEPGIDTRKQLFRLLKKHQRDEVPTVLKFLQGYGSRPSEIQSIPAPPHPAESAARDYLRWAVTEFDSDQETRAAAAEVLQPNVRRPSWQRLPQDNRPKETENYDPWNAPPIPEFDVPASSEKPAPSATQDN